VYRRFQITFLSSSAVLEFIDAIRTICPCKANPVPGIVPGPALALSKAKQTFKAPVDNQSTPIASILTAERAKNQVNLPSGLPASLGPPITSLRDIPSQNLQTSSQVFALTTSETNVYPSSPLRGLASCVPNSLASCKAMNNRASALLNSNLTRSSKTFRNKYPYLIHHHPSLQAELAPTPIPPIAKPTVLY
jgi:hypothetical protein